MPGASSARRRTAAQRKAGEKDDELQQEAELRELHKQNDLSNAWTRNALDFITITVALIVLSQGLSRSPSPSLRSISIAQVVLLLFSLTPTWLPILDLFRPAHRPAVALNVVLLLAAWVLLRTHDARAGSVIWYALPVMVATVVEWQRREERAALVRLARLESLKYDLKGA